MKKRKNLGIILRILKILQSQTDSEHLITQSEIAKILRKDGINCRRYILVRNIETLKEFGYDIKVASTISLIITELIRIWMRQGFHFSSKTTFDQFSNKEFSVLEYIDKHSSENINIEDLASKCGMCYSNFAKQFKAQFGKTCKEYIEFVRICKADTLLLYTDKTLDYISQETGFTDASHFIRTYKKIRGITPKQRRNSRE